MTTKTVRLPKGIRNNNPLNLRESPGDKTIWLHERATDDDAQFEEFDIPEGGIRAAAINFRTYKIKWGVRTVHELVTRWAPPKGKDANGVPYTQDTNAYIRLVCNALGVDSGIEVPPRTRDVIDLEDWETLFSLMKVMIRHENGPAPRNWQGRDDGTWYSDDLIIRGMNMARVTRPSVAEQVTRSPTVQTAAVTAVGGATIGISELLTVANAGKGFAEMDMMAMGRILLVVLVVLGSLYIINRRAKHAKG